MASIHMSPPSSSPSLIFKPPTSHRTNSLGWAKSDCHNCRLASRVCDRRRPRCDACTAEETTCGGYVQDLQWRDQSHKIRSEIQRQSSTISPESQRNPAKTKDFAFVQEDGRQTKKRKRRRRTSQTSKPTSQEVPVEIPLISPTPGVELSLEKRPSEPGFDLVPVLYRQQPEYFKLPSSSIEQIAFFTWRFSPVTLTYEIKANPWQACLQQIDQASFLLDAVRALSIRHRSHLEEKPESLSVLELKDTALSSFAQSISTVPLEVGISVSLILIGIDYAESALGNWIVHLQGVYRMIENAGGIYLRANHMHLRAQIAQLVWYDTIIALLSRRDPIFPREYVECVLSWKNESQWSLLALNGFPDAAFLVMYEVAEAAAHADELSDGHVTGLEMKLWLARFETEQGANDTEISALSDCWRLGLLLYCTRVFHQGESMKRKARLLAEEIMWLVHEFPPESNKQKQALLPLFLAACEMESFRFRQIAIDFCENWKKKSGLWLNQTAIDIVKTVWAAVDEDPEDEDIWWGDFVNPPADSGYLFG